MITKKQIAAVKKKKPVRKKAKKKVAKKRVAKKASKKKAPRRKSNGRATIRIDRALFCKELIKNSMNATAAYKAVSPKVTDKTAAANGHRLLREAETVDMLTPMLQELFIDAGIEANYVFKRWVEMSQASPLDYFRINDEGEMYLRSSESLTQAQRVNLRKIKVTKNETQSKDGETLHITTRTEVEVVDQQRAVSEIAKHLGLLMDKLADEDVERIGDLLEKGVARITSSRDLDGWKSIVFDGEATEV